MAAPRGDARGGPGAPSERGAVTLRHSWGLDGMDFLFVLGPCGGAPAALPLVKTAVLVD